jgi:outer membrane protein OmpA-like peptidoglycan-associated protein
LGLIAFPFLVVFGISERTSAITSLLRANVAHRLRAEPLRRVTLTLDGRDVTLGGQVTIDEDRQEAGRLVSIERGVRGVRNEIVVSGGIEVAQLEVNATLLDGIKFETGRAVILEESMPVLERLRGSLERTPNYTAQINGYTNAGGSEDDNRALTERQAQAVVDWFVAHGINKRRLRAAGLGSANPIAANDDELGRAMNRRIEIVLSETK